MTDPRPNRQYYIVRSHEPVLLPFPVSLLMRHLLCPWWSAVYLCCSALGGLLCIFAALPVWSPLGSAGLRPAMPRFVGAFPLPSSVFPFVFKFRSKDFPMKSLLFL